MVELAEALRFRSGAPSILVAAGLLTTLLYERILELVSLAVDKL